MIHTKDQLEQQRKNLTALRKEVLVDALLELAVRDSLAGDIVDRIVSSPMENLKRFKQKLAALKRSRRFIPWGESASLARQLEEMLNEVKAAVSDPELGTELVAAFFEADKDTLGRCDDSSGYVGEVYRSDAVNLFADYARRCSDKDRLVTLVFRVIRQNDFGIRDTLIEKAAEYLPEPGMRGMIGLMQEAADSETDHGKNHWRQMISSLARQLKDAQLFETTRLATAARFERIPTATCIDIARVYLESGDTGKALSWIEKIPENETFQDHERDQVLLEIHRRHGDAKRQEEVAWRIFRRGRSAHALETLLGVIGEDRREETIEREVSSIIAATPLSTVSLSKSDVAFLVGIGRIDDAERYLLERADKLEGDDYTNLPPLAETMEKAGHHLAASLIYRALLDSLLQRAHTKAYPHGVRYLKKLDRLAPSIADWRGQTDHETYKAELRRAHGRKSAFWSRYDK
jgi:hypothetical protein